VIVVYCFLDAAAEIVRMTLKTAATGVHVVAVVLSPVAGINRARGVARYTVAVHLSWGPAEWVQGVTMVDSRGYLVEWTMGDLQTWLVSALPGAACRVVVHIDNAATLPKKWTAARVTKAAARIGGVVSGVLASAAAKVATVTGWAESGRKAAVIEAAARMVGAAAMLQTAKDLQMGVGMNLFAGVGVVDGVSGGVGPAGPQGVQGVQGVPGAAGAVGAQGPQGVPGVDGAQGLQGAQGPQGLPGGSGAAPLVLDQRFVDANQTMLNTAGIFQFVIQPGYLQYFAVDIGAGKRAVMFGNVVGNSAAVFALSLWDGYAYTQNPNGLINDPLDVSLDMGGAVGFTPMADAVGVYFFGVQIYGDVALTIELELSIGNVGGY
jgi:hypothetical protein